MKNFSNWQFHSTVHVRMPKEHFIVSPLMVMFTKLQRDKWKSLSVLEVNQQVLSLINKEVVLLLIKLIKPCSVKSSQKMDKESRLLQSSRISMESHLKVQTLWFFLKRTTLSSSPIPDQWEKHLSNHHVEAFSQLI